MLDFVAHHSKKYDEFSSNIVDFRKNDDIVSFIEIIFIELSKVLPNNIKYLGWSVKSDPIRENELKGSNIMTQIKPNKKPELILYSKDTYYKLVVYNFELTLEQARGDQTLSQKCLQEVPIAIPILIDNYHYFIRGNKYCAPLQVVDSLFYSNQGDIIILKTLARAITISRASYKLLDIFGNEYPTYNYFISIINNVRSPLILFYFSHYGFENTFKFFGCDKLVKLVNFDNEEIPNLPKNKLYFRFCKYYLEVDREEFLRNTKFKQFLACVLSVQKRTMTLEQIQGLDKWLAILGDQMLEINSINKGKNMMQTFKNSLDYITKSLIAKTVENGTLKSLDIFAVVKWIFFDFNNITSKSTVDLSNKRIRLGEYMVSIIIKQLYKKLYKFINKPQKSQDMKSLQDIFKINSLVLPHTIIGKIKTSDMNLNIMKFCDYVNDNSFLVAGLSATHAGPGSPIEKSKKNNISLVHRKLDPSAPGNVAIIETSSNDPGVNMDITPMASFNIDTGMFNNTNLSSYKANIINE